MKLSRRIERALIFLGMVVLAFVFGFLIKANSGATFADAESVDAFSEGVNFVTFYDSGKKLTIKTNAKTVADAVSGANIVINDGDKVEPSLDTEINADNFFINIYRSRPVILRDGLNERYVMTASYSPTEIFTESGVTVYDGDEIKLVNNTNFLEAGVAMTYEIKRNGGRAVTVEEEIPFSEESVRDFNLASGSTEVRQIGEVGTKKITYNVLYVNNEEVSREVISEEVVREPVSRIVAIGAKKSIPPEWSVCAEWAREAGVSEADLSIALDLIYRESGCRVDAENYSSGAYGIPQALPGSKMASAGSDWRTNPITQIRWMIGYVNGRYGGWQGAAEWWYSHRWY
ncbi:G5 domain-containing protein [Candidatus Saccharibacteria bacterium]|nr:G5 domain-containing protein [Candidatus Saccharibacteria bacterium]